MTKETGTFVLLAVWGLAAGAALAVQSGLNAQLARRLGHPALASCASFLVGTTVLVVYCLALRLPWPSAEEVRQGPLWAWAGGLLGAFFVVSTVVLAPRLGATGLIAVVIAGQSSWSRRTRSSAATRWQRLDATPTPPLGQPDADLTEAVGSEAGPGEVPGEPAKHWQAAEMKTRAETVA